MSGHPVVVIGAGGRGQVVADALHMANRVVLGFVDRSGPAARSLDLPIPGDDARLRGDGGYDLANGVGGTGQASTRGMRRELQGRLEREGFVLTQVRHPSAIVSSGAHVGAGATVQQEVTLENDIVIGAGALVLEPGTGAGPLMGVPARRKGTP